MIKDCFRRVLDGRKHEYKQNMKFSYSCSSNVKRHFLASVAITNGVVIFGTAPTTFKSGKVMLIC